MTADIHGMTSGRPCLRHAGKQTGPEPRFVIPGLTRNPVDNKYCGKIAPFTLTRVEEE